MELTTNEIAALETVREKINNFCKEQQFCSRCPLLKGERCIASFDLMGVLLEKFGNKEG